MSERKQGQRGGARQGSGRPRGSGKYNEPTQPLRLPLSLLPYVDRLLSAYSHAHIAEAGAASGESSHEHVLDVADASDDNLVYSLGDSQKTRVPRIAKHHVAPTQVIYGEPDANASLRVTEQYVIEPRIKLSLPLYGSRVAAGFPSPAADYVEGRIDLNTLLVKHAAATFLVRVQGDSMIGAGIHPNDILIVDRSLTPTDGRIVIAVISGELTVKRLQTRANHVTLFPENPAYQPIVVNDNSEFMIWGVVTNVIHSL